MLLMSPTSTPLQRNRQESPGEASSSWSPGAPPLVQVSRAEVSPCSLPRPQAGQEGELYQVLLERLRAVEGAIKMEAGEQEGSGPENLSRQNVLGLQESERFLDDLRTKTTGRLSQMDNALVLLEEMHTEDLRAKRQEELRKHEELRGRLASLLAQQSQPSGSSQIDLGNFQKPGATMSSTNALYGHMSSSNALNLESHETEVPPQVDHRMSQRLPLSFDHSCMSLEQKENLENQVQRGLENQKRPQEKVKDYDITSEQEEENDCWSHSSSHPLLPRISHKSADMVQDHDDIRLVRVPSPSRPSPTSQGRRCSPGCSTSRLMDKSHASTTNSEQTLHLSSGSYVLPVTLASQVFPSSNSASSNNVRHVEAQQLSSPGRSEADSVISMDFEYDLLFDVMNKLPRSEVNRLSAYFQKIENEKQQLKDEVGSLQKQLRPDTEVAPTDPGLAILHSVMRGSVVKASPCEIRSEVTPVASSGPLAAASLRLPLSKLSSVRSDSLCGPRETGAGVVSCQRVMTPVCTSQPLTPRELTPRERSLDRRCGQSCGPPLFRHHVTDSPQASRYSIPAAQAMPMLSVAKHNSSQGSYHSWVPTTARLAEAEPSTPRQRALANHTQHLSLQPPVAVAHVVESPRINTGVIRQSSAGRQHASSQSCVARQSSAERWVASPRIAIQTASSRAMGVAQLSPAGKQAASGAQISRFPDLTEYSALPSPRRTTIQAPVGQSSVIRQSSAERPLVVRQSSAGGHYTPAFGTSPCVVSWSSSIRSSSATKPAPVVRQSAAARPSLRGRYAPTCYLSLKERSTSGLH